MLRILLPTLLLASLPLASASECDDVPGLRLCSGEWTEGDACSEPDTMAWGYTYAHASTHDGLASVIADGSYDCWRFDDGFGGEETYRRDEIRASARVADTRATLTWNADSWTFGEETETHCATTLEARRGTQSDETDVGCPLGAPPAIGWGRVLA